jgi:hypothetical protein
MKFLVLAALAAYAADLPIKKKSPAERSPAADFCACAANKQCWKTTMTAYGQTSSARLTEIEAAEPNRFFPGTFVSAMQERDQNGDFLIVRCGAGNCDDLRDELEKRVLFTSFLGVMPSKGGKDRVYDPKTWALTETGMDAIKAAKVCRPDLLVELGRNFGIRARGERRQARRKEED